MSAGCTEPEPAKFTKAFRSGPGTIPCRCCVWTGSSRAEQAVQSQRASLSQLQQQLVETRTALAILLQIPVQQLNIQKPQRLPVIRLPVIGAGLPAEILARRPDLRAAELRLRQALATKDATRASYYPSISLTGNLGSTSTSLTQLLQNPALTLGANLSLPFCSGMI